MIKIKYIISGKLKSGSSFKEKEFYVYAKNERDADERIHLCLSNDEKISSWEINDKLSIKDNKKYKKHMLGVWYKPYE